MPFWYRLTRVVPDKGPLNGYVCVYIYDLNSYTLHAKRGRVLYMRNDLIDVSSQLPTSHCDVVETGGYNIANVYKPSSEPWEDTNPLPSLPHTAVYVGDFNSHLPDTTNNDSDMLLHRDSKNVNRFSNSCNGRLIGKFATKLYFNITPHLKYQPW